MKSLFLLSTFFHNRQHYQYVFIFSTKFSFPILVSFFLFYNHDSFLILLTHLFFYDFGGLDSSLIIIISVYYRSRKVLYLFFYIVSIFINPTNFYLSLPSSSRIFGASFLLSLSKFLIVLGKFAIYLLVYLLPFLCQSHTTCSLHHKSCKPLLLKDIPCFSSYSFNVSYSLHNVFAKLTIIFI